MIITANAYLNLSWEAYNVSVIKPMLEKYGVKPEISESEPLMAEVNHGRWIVRCECGGAEKMWEEGWFICQSCWNAGHKHKYRQAVFPSGRNQIEKLLLRRQIQNRNWIPGETLEQLDKENEEHKEELLNGLDSRRN